MNLLRAMATVSSMTLASRVLGYARDFFIARAFGAGLAITAALGVAAAPLIVYVSAPGFASDPDKFELTVSLLRITFPYILFISLVALAAGIVTTWNRFAG